LREAKSIMLNSSNMVYKLLVVGVIILFCSMSVVSSTDNIAKDIPTDCYSLESFYNPEEKFSHDTTWYCFWLYGPEGTGFYAFYPNGTYNFCEYGGVSFSGGTWTNDGRYLCCEYELGYLYDVDPETLEPQFIGGGGVGLNGLAYDPVEDILYGASSDSFYEIDIDTGEQNYIGSFGTSTTMIAIAFDIDGVCYGWDVLFSGESHLYTIDTDTGEATVVGGMGYNLLYNQDGAFELDTDVLYLVAYTSGQGCLLECDEDTGECTLIGYFEGVTNPTAFAISYEYYDTTPPVTTYSLDPSEPDGWNGWYVSDVTIMLESTDDVSGVKEIRYCIDGWSEHVIPGDSGSFILHGDGDDILVEYWAVDNAGNVETKNELELDIDRTVPEITLTYEHNGKWWEDWVFKFTATATDAMSGMDCVEFYANNELQEIVTGPGPTYTWTIKYLPTCKLLIRATGYDKAGLSESDEVYDPKISSNDYLRNIQQNNKNINFLKTCFDDWRCSYEE
jgi:hypothetical protein